MIVKRVYFLKTTNPWNPVLVTILVVCVFLFLKTSGISMEVLYIFNYKDFYDMSIVCLRIGYEVKTDPFIRTPRSLYRHINLYVNKLSQSLFWRVIRDAE